MRYGVITGVILLCVAAWWFLPLGESAATIRYQTQQVATGDIESVVNTAGTTKAVVTVEVGTEISGLITELHVDFNDDVVQGQIIAKLDDRTYIAKVRQAEADVVMAKASVAQQQATLAKSEAELTRTERAYLRQQELMRQKLTNQSDLDDAFATYQSAKAQINLSNAQISSAEAQLLQREAQLEQAQLDLDRTTIRSPVNGTVIDRQVDIGQTVAASLSAPTLFTIAQDLSQMQIEADVDEADIGKVQQGQQVRFQVDAYPDRHFRGEVAQVRKAATNVSNVVTYKVIINAPNQQQLLLPGMTANMNIIRGQKNDILRVPNAALRFRPAGMSSASAAAGSRMAQPDMAAELIKALELPADKTGKVQQLYRDFAQNLQHMRNQTNNTPGSDQRQGLQQQRQKLENELQLVLSEEEYQRYKAFNETRRNQRQQGETQGTAAQVWILDQKQQPKAVNIRVGLSNDEYSEVISGELKTGDAVIVRAVRAE
ncbi:efflux RND transporter periplasmic adaptor subunit [Chromatiaceae bacterium AAb-1]|nr:efflux RND transporter periplasmic adaptor subunit [Chromatiaceae bacterium AAb-1]